jgi:hypothetical protein
VGDLIDAVEAELNSALASIGYRIPVVEPISKRILRDMVSQEVASRVLHAQVLGVRDADELGARRAHALYMERLQALVDPNNPFTLPDATVNDRADKLVAEIGSSFSDGTTEEYDSERSIKRDMVF